MRATVTDTSLFRIDPLCRARNREWPGSGPTGKSESTVHSPFLPVPTEIATQFGPERTVRSMLEGSYRRSGLHNATMPPHHEYDSSPKTMSMILYDPRARNFGVKAFICPSGPLLISDIGLWILITGSIELCGSRCPRGGRGHRARRPGSVQGVLGPRRGSRAHRGLGARVLLAPFHSSALV